MSLVLAQASRLKADIRFAQAMKAFEADLSKEQQAEFRASIVPDISDVMRLTAQFDRALSLKGHLRGYGPRLTNFLESVQKFASIGDILVGGSQNLPASGAWALVRFALMSLVQFPKNIDKLSTLFMDIGRSAPRHQNIRALCPQSRHLLVYLMEYQIVVIKFCHKIYKLSQFSAFRQLTSSIDDWVGKSKDELAKWAEVISDEVTLQTALTLQGETKKSSVFHALWKNNNARQVADRASQMRSSLANLCSTYDFRRTWKQIRKQATTTIFSQEQAYQKWIAYSYSCTLVYSGILGAGKSVVLANIVDDLFLNCDKQNVTVTYFFCRKDDKESLQPSVILGSLACQILAGNAVPDEELSEFEETLKPGISSLTVEDLCGLIEKVMLLRKKQELIFVLDGLHECDFDSKNEVLEALQTLQNSIWLRLCLAMRHEPNVVAQLNLEKLHNVSLMSIPEIHPDMPEYIRSELIRLKECQRLSISEDGIMDEICETLLQHAGGMFLWVTLQISALTYLLSDHAIRRSLRKPPRTLNGVYSQLLECSDPTQSDQQDLILSLVSVAIRPLTTAELKEALSVTPGNTEYDPAKLVNNVYLLFALCRGLVVVDEEELTVRLVHPSVADFIHTRKQRCIPQGVAEQYMAETILTYLNYPIFDTRLARVQCLIPDISLMPSRIVASITGSPKLASFLLKNKSKTKADLTRIIRDSIHSIRLSADTPVSFKSYADLYWNQHLLNIQLLPDKEMVHMPCLILLQQALSKRRLSTGSGDDFDSLLHLAAAQGSLDLVQKIFDTILASSKSLTHALWIVADKGLEEMAKLMLKTDGFRASYCDSEGKSTAMAAASSGSVAILGMLLYSGIAKAESLEEEMDCRGWTALCYAASNGQVEMVLFLLQIIYPQPKAIKRTCTTKYGEMDLGQLTALIVAAEYGETDIVNILLQDARISPYTEYSAYGEPLRTAFEIAASKGDALTVQALLCDPRFDPACHESHMFWSPLSPPSATGHTHTAYTALCLAISQGFSEVVKLLLANSRVDPNVIPALCMAVTHRYLEVVKVLLADPRVDRNKSDGMGRTALGHCVDAECAMLLLSDSQVDPNWNDDNGNCPLATVRGDDTIRVLLADKRVKTSTKNNEGLDVLMKAIKEINLEKVRVYLESELFDLEVALKFLKRHEIKLRRRAERNLKTLRLEKIIQRLSEQLAHQEKLYGQNPVVVTKRTQ